MAGAELFLGQRREHQRRQAGKIFPEEKVCRDNQYSRARAVDVSYVCSHFPPSLQIGPLTQIFTVTQSAWESVCGGN